MTDVPAWPLDRMGDALAAVARTLGGRSGPTPEPPADADRGPDVGRWMAASARVCRLESSPVDARSSLPTLARPGEALVLRANGAPAFVVALGEPRDGRLVMLRPDESRVSLPVGAVARVVLGGAPAVAVDRLDGLCRRLRIAPSFRAAAAEVLGGGEPRAGGIQGWSLAPSPASFGARLVAAGALGLAVRAVLATAATLALWLGAWWLVGRGALEGRLEPGWLWAWMLMLVSVVGCQASASWATAKLAVQLGGLTRERLLEGILAFSPEAIRSQGVGQLLGAVLETEALEVLARSVGPSAASASVQLLAGSLVLALGAAPLLDLGALAVWLAVLGLLGAHYYRLLVDWADGRLALTHDLVESMVGHRTLVTQGRPMAGDDRLSVYERRSAALDGAAATLFTVAPRGWLLVGLLALGPGFVAGTAAPDGLAVSLGGMLLVYWALRRLVEATPGLAAAALAWRRTRPFFAAAAAAEAAPHPAVVATAADQAAAGRHGLLVGRDVCYQYPDRPEPVLKGCSFAIHTGDRVLLRGRSGSGKSTLGALLTGLRQPSSGVLLLGGYDHHSLGPQRWRERSGSVPQFHENHVLTASLVFNLLMGRGWPPRPDDWREVEALCAELGLGPMLARMPAGLQQMVGDSGWQLSHGERSRLYLARSLLQDLDVRVLDESFAALDPETLERVLECVLRRTRTLVVVTHV